MLKDKFQETKRLTEPVYQVPKSSQQILDIYRIFEDGTFQIERPSKKNRRMLFDRVYQFNDINYQNKNDEEKDSICQVLCKIFNSLNVSFKIIVANETRDLDTVKERVLRKPEESEYPFLAEANNQLILDGLQVGNPDLEQKHYWVLTTRQENIEDARNYFSVLEETLEPLFNSIKSSFTKMTAIERLQSIHNFFRPEFTFQLSWDELIKGKRDWRNDVCPYQVKHGNIMDEYLDLGNQLVSVLFAPSLPNTLNESKTISQFSRLDFPIFFSLDIANIPQNELKRKLRNGYVNNDRAIAKEQEIKAKAQNYAGGISFAKQKKRDELEDYMARLDDNDEQGFWAGILITIKADTKEELEKRKKAVQMAASGIGIPLIPYYHQQIQALNTALPIGARRVNNMRTLLTTSLAAFQPFYAQDVFDTSGYFYGINRLTKNIIMLDRKKLKNTNGVIFGHTGSGKSMFAKMTEIGQTLISTDDDIFVIDPQNEFQVIAEEFNGQFFDLSAQSGIYLNPLEIPDEILQTKDNIQMERFIADKSSFMEAFCYAVMFGFVPTGIHKTIIDKCVVKMYHTFFSKKFRKQPTMKDFYELLQEEDDMEARDIYGALGSYVNGTFNMFSRKSNLDIHNRFVVFGLKNVSEDMWEPVMITIMHLLAQKMDHNNSAEVRRAIHFLVDEAQYVCQRESSTDQLLKAFITFRKYGGINTIMMQNISAAQANKKIEMMVSNADFKVFLDQGGSDRLGINNIVELSDKEYEELGNLQIGQCLIQCGDKILECDSRMNTKNPLYDIYSTNFYEKDRIHKEESTEEAKGEKFIQEEVKISKEEQDMLDLISDVGSMTQDEIELIYGEEAETILKSTIEKGLIIKEGTVYQRASK